MAATQPANGPMEIPDIPPETTASEIITALGFDPADVHAVVVTGASVIAVSASIPGGPTPPDPEPEPT